MYYINNKKSVLFIRTTPLKVYMKLKIKYLFCFMEIRAIFDEK